MCISAASDRSLESRPCEPRLRVRARLTSGARTARRVPSNGPKPQAVARPSLLGRSIAWVLLIFGVLLVVLKLLPSLL